jgi:thiosulfate/3-mercaptopyruvate sulfurtransferase
MIPMVRVLPAFVVFLGWELAPARTVQPRPGSRAISKVRPRADAESLLISPAVLRERLARGGVVVLHVGERADYNAGHIPGARFLPYESVSTPRGTGLMLEIPPAATLDSLLESLGVSDGTRIVLYSGRDWSSPTARVFLTLDYLGLGDRTSLLDGGFGAWKADGGAVSRDVGEVARGSLTVRPRPDVIVDARAVRAAVGDARVAIVDARSPRFYSGEAEGMNAREGHVKGARNVPFNTLLDERGAFRSRAELEAALDAVGATASKRLIGYCEIGQQASVLYFVGRLLGRDVRLYDGSWDEWSRHADYPIESGRGETR